MFVRADAKRLADIDVVIDCAGNMPRRSLADGVGTAPVGRRGYGTYTLQYLDFRKIFLKGRRRGNVGSCREMNLPPRSRSPPLSQG